MHFFNKLNRVVILLLLLPFVLVGCIPVNGTSKESSVDEIILIGDDQVIIINYAESTEENKSITWQLKSSEIIGLPDSLHKYFKTLDDAKSVDNDTKLLISASSGGVALIDRKTKKCLFYAKSPMAHSIEYLPNNKIAVVLSTASKGGNCVEIYDADQSDVPLFTDSLYSGHGVTWNKDRELLYALGFDKLRAYSLKNWNSQTPELKLEKEWKLPATGGHDLFAPTSDNLLLSTSNEVWEFNLNSEQFISFDPIGKEDNVKSIFLDDKTEELIYTKGEISWWTHQIHFLNPAKVIQVPEMNLYKIRVIKKSN